LAEQEKIVELLEDHLSRLDAAIASVRAVRTKATKFRRSLLHAAFTGDLINSPVTSWEEKTLGELASLSLGKMLDKKQDKGANPTPYLRNINVRWGRINTNDLFKMDIAPTQLERVSLSHGDVVVCEGGEPGRTAIWTGDQTIAIQKALHRIRPHATIDSKFLSYFLEREFRGIANHPLFTGTTIKHLPKEKIASLLLRLPPVEEQRRITAVLEEQLSRLDATLVVVDAVEKRTSSLRRSLLHAAFTGKLTESWREDAHV